MKPEIEHGIYDKDTWWYRCPICHDELEYNQKKCGYCGQAIDWSKDGEQDVD